MTQDMEEGRTTEEELNNVLASMAWGTIDPSTSEFLVETEEPTLDSPNEAWILGGCWAFQMCPICFHEFASGLITILKNRYSVKRPF